MKTLYKTLTILFLSITIFSCSSNDDSTDDEQSNYYLTAKVNGVNFTRDNAIVSALTGNTAYYTIAAVDENTSISISLSNPIALGTFTPAVGKKIALSYQSNNPFIVWAASEDIGSGTVTITENTATYIKGTFSFTGVSLLENTTKKVTEGKFKAKKL